MVEMLRNPDTSVRPFAHYFRILSSMPPNLITQPLRGVGFSPRGALAPPLFPRSPLPTSRKSQPTPLPCRPHSLPFLRVSASLRQIVILSLAASLLPAQPPSAERQLEAAIHREIVLGDLAGAMEQYRAILSHSGAARPVAARALLQIGECQEKLGHRVEADIAYRRVVADFSDQSDLVTQARMELAAWSGPRNLKFEEGVPGKLPPGWFVPSLPKDADYLAELRRVGCHSGVGCAVVMVPVNVPKPLGNLMQNFSAAAYQGKTVRLRALLKVEAYYPTATS